MQASQVNAPENGGSICRLSVAANELLVLRAELVLPPVFPRHDELVSRPTVLEVDRLADRVDVLANDWPVVPMNDPLIDSLNYQLYEASLTDEDRERRIRREKLGLTLDACQPSSYLAMLSK